MKSIKKVLIGYLLIFVCAVFGAAEAYGQGDENDLPEEEAKLNGKVALVETIKGKFAIELWPDIAPNHVERFIGLAEAGFFNDKPFHHILRGQFALFGRPDGTALRELSTPIDAELKSVRVVPGTVFLEHPEEQFDLGTTEVGISFFRIPARDGEYTCFGQVFRGMSVVRAISAVGSVPAVGTGSALPQEEVLVHKVTIMDRSELDKHEPLNPKK